MTMTARPGAVFFDMDGTILDWQTGMEESWLASCEAHCDGSFAPAALHEAIRARRTWFWDDPERARAGRLDLDAASREIVRHAFADVGLRDIQIADGIADDYRSRRTAAITPYPGAIETLAALRERGARLALLTNGGAESQRRSIERFSLAQYFDCIVIEGEFGCGKPDARVFRHALAAVGCEPATAWMVGDNLEADIAPAVALGLHAVWVDGGGAQPSAARGVRPHRTVRAISELL
ncbi:MAG: HAD family hydrolase [Dehalococcoidia bacterium]